MVDIGTVDPSELLFPEDRRRYLVLRSIRADTSISRAGRAAFVGDTLHYVLPQIAYPIIPEGTGTLPIVPKT